MYYYEIGYWSHEECPKHILTNEKEYSQGEFDELVSNCYVEAYNNKIKADKEDAEAYNNKIKTDKEYDDFSYTAEDLIDYVIEILNNNFGFKEPITKAKFNPFGWASLKNKIDWDGHRDFQLNLITDKINKT
jgi:hypothetical protein